MQVKSSRGRQCSEQRLHLWKGCSFSCLKTDLSMELQQQPPKISDVVECSQICQELEQILQTVRVAHEQVSVVRSMRHAATLGISPMKQRHLHTVQQLEMQSQSWTTVGEGRQCLDESFNGVRHDCFSTQRYPSGPPVLSEKIIFVLKIIF